jgi:hypothetical protein
MTAPSLDVTDFEIISKDTVDEKGSDSCAKISAVLGLGADVHHAAVLGVMSEMVTKIIKAHESWVSDPSRLTLLWY